MGLNENNILKVVLDAAGQVTELKGLVAGEDTISSDLLNSDIRDAGSNAQTALDTANAADGKADTAVSTANAADAKFSIAGGTVLGNLTGGTQDAAGVKVTDVVIDNNTIDGVKIKDDTITGFKVLDASLSAAQIKDGEITNVKLAGSISQDKLAGGITGFQIADNTLSAGQIKDGEVTNAKLAGSIAANKLAGGIAGSQLAAGANIAGSQLADNAGITGFQIADNTLSAGQIKDGEVTNAKLAGSIALTKLSTITQNRILGATAADGVVTEIQVTNELIPANEINGSKIVHGTIGTDELATVGTAVTQIKNSTITTDANGRVTACTSGGHVYLDNNIGFLAISGAAGESVPTTEDKSVLMYNQADGKFNFKKVTRGIGNGEIDGVLLADDSITEVKLSTGAVTSNKLATGAASGNIIIGGLALNKLTPIAAGNFLGNPNTLGAPVESVGKSDARRMLGLSAGTVAPSSPDAGDLWYNTTDDELYTYDSGRSHWLGAPYYISFGKANAATASGVGHYLYVGHQGTTATTSERGWLVPHDMVITGWRGHTQSTFTGWNARVDKNSGGTNTTGIVQTGVQGAVDTFSDFTLDVDVAAGDILGVALVLGSVTLNNSTVTVKIQRKGA